MVWFCSNDLSIFSLADVVRSFQNKTSEPIMRWPQCIFRLCIRMLILGDDFAVGDGCIGQTRVFCSTMCFLFVRIFQGAATCNGVGRIQRGVRHLFLPPFSVYPTNARGAKVEYVRRYRSIIVFRIEQSNKDENIKQLNNRNFLFPCSNALFFWRLLITITGKPFMGERKIQKGKKRTSHKSILGEKSDQISVD